MKRKYESMITKHGEIIDSKCAACDGEGVDFIDYTHSKGGDMIPQLCSLCEGYGFVTSDMVDDITYDNDGNQQIVYKTENELNAKSSRK